MNFTESPALGRGLWDLSMPAHFDCIFVYIITNKRNGTLYTGLSTDLVKRTLQHKQEIADGFTKKFGLKRLVYYEMHSDIQAAAHRERLLKKWHREWKIRLIEEMNPDWADLFADLKRKING